MIPLVNVARESAAFADHLTWLLDATVCNGPRLVAVADGPDRAIVRYGGRGPALVPLTLGAKPPRAYLDVWYRTHLPVGGRRFRPTVEDVVQYAVVEGVAEARPGWQRAVEAGRAKFHASQLRAAVRRDPDGLAPPV